MMNRWMVGFLLALAGLAAPPAFSQVERVEMRVDGLACPFCAYGLEKKLDDVPGVSEIEIRVDDGIVIVKAKENESVAVERLKPAVRDAGFTAREITATALGSVARVNGQTILRVRGGDTKFILQDSPTVNDLQAKLRGDQGIRLTGRLAGRTPGGHHAHPYTMTVETFEILDSKTE